LWRRRDPGAEEAVCGEASGAGHGERGGQRPAGAGAVAGARGPGPPGGRRQPAIPPGRRDHHAEGAAGASRHPEVTAGTAARRCFCHVSF